MVNILAVSDEELHPHRNESIEDLLPPEETRVDILLNCGDLSPNYLEYLIEKYRPHTRIMVHGNHDANFYIKEQATKDPYKIPKQIMEQKDYRFESEEKYSISGKFKKTGFSKVFKGMYVLNRGIYELNSEDPGEQEDDLVIAGFSGAMAHGDLPFYFSEKDAKQFVRELKVKRFLGKHFNGEPENIDIMMSHSAPKIKDLIPDIDHHHRPSRELGKIYKEFHPRLWLYGHIHPRYIGDQTDIDSLDFKINRKNDPPSYLINTVPFKFIVFDEFRGEVDKIFPKEYKTF